MTGPILEAQDVSVRLGRKPVVNDVSFSAGTGAVIGVLGPNGAGKSTLLKALVMLVKSTGSIHVQGRDVRNLAAAELGRAIAYLPQDRDVAWPMSAASVVALGRLPYGGGALAQSYKHENQNGVRKAMAAVDVMDFADRRISELSGGERARVLMARALAQDAPILLADEPTAGLDPAHQIALLALLRQLATKGRLAIVTLHELHFAAQWCDRVLLLHDGRLVGDGPPSEILTAERIRSVYGCDVRIIEDVQGSIIVPVPKRTGRPNEEGAPKWTLDR